MKRIVMGAIVICLLLAVVLAWQIGTAQPKQNTNGNQDLSCNPKEHYMWAMRSLIEMHTVHAGMTRADLLKVFCEEGGLSTVKQQTYVYRKFRMFKVDVTFSHSYSTFDESKKPITSKSPFDIITKISKPYLEGAIID